MRFQVSSFKFRVAALVLVSALTFATLVSQTACTKGQMVAAAKDVASALHDAQPFITQLVPGKAARFAQAVGEAEKLVTAIEASDKTTAASLIADIFPAIDEVASDLGANTKVLAILAIANISLHFLVNHLPQSKMLAVAGGATYAKLAAFKQRPVWRCRDASSGRFLKMEQCRLRPAMTVVERY